MCTKINDLHYDDSKTIASYLVNIILVLQGKDFSYS